MKFHKNSFLLSTSKNIRSFIFKSCRIILGITSAEGPYKCEYFPNKLNGLIII